MLAAGPRRGPGRLRSQSDAALSRVREPPPPPGSAALPTRFCWAPAGPALPPVVGASLEASVESPLRPRPSRAHTRVLCCGPCTGVSPEACLQPDDKMLTGLPLAKATQGHLRFYLSGPGLELKHFDIENELSTTVVSVFEATRISLGR